jgi:hypothetical protein
MPGAPALAAESGRDHKAVASAIRLLEQERLLERQGLGRPTDCKDFAFGGRLLKQPLGRTNLPVEVFAKTGGRVP